MPQSMNVLFKLPTSQRHIVYEESVMCQTESRITVTSNDAQRKTSHQPSSQRTHDILLQIAFSKEIPSKCSNKVHTTFNIHSNPFFDTCNNDLHEKLMKQYL